MVTETPQQARDDDFGLSFGPDLRTPLHAVRSLHVEAGTEAAVIARDQLVRRLARRRQLFAADTPEQVARRITRIDPQLTELLWRRRRRRHVNRAQGST